ncbi:hypothetical protein [Nonomuraea sediminis]|uniref:hypothetical protein n=1 Tax=Nonomuraea sediminis TaxID=2835864 RepID=UPI001BDCAB07|nr:hypothetical protein [Nonomuraea sediminis]
MADDMLDASELLALAAYIEDGVQRAAEGAYPLVKEHALKLRDQWRDNAKRSAGRHGKHYHRSITAEQIPRTDAAEWEVGPNRALKQGSMGRGFEYGSAHQPPHLDGARATVAIAPDFNKAVDEFMRSLL